MRTPLFKKFQSSPRNIGLLIFFSYLERNVLLLYDMSCASARTIQECLTATVIVCNCFVGAKML